MPRLSGPMIVYRRSWVGKIIAGMAPGLRLEQFCGERSLMWSEALARAGEAWLVTAFL
jgi:hypothetical protein